MKCCINGGNVIRLLFLSAKLLKFQIQKCRQILCAHKPYFLMPGHIYVYFNFIYITWGDQTTEVYSTIGLTYTYVLYARDFIVDEHFLRFLCKNACAQLNLLYCRYQ